jgi:hypothetical protein
LGIGGVVESQLCYIAKIVLNFKFGHDMNISNMALLLAAGNVADKTTIQYNKLAYLLLTTGEL